MEETAKVGAEPTWKMLLKPLMNERGQVGENNQDSPPEGDVKPDSPPAGEKPQDSPPEKVPWDDDPRWKEWRGSEKKLQTVLKANEVGSIEELESLIEEGMKIKGRIKDVGDLEALIEKASTFDQYQDYWAHQDELKKRESEEPDETIKRLEKRIEDQKLSKKQEQKARGEAVEAQKAIKDYEREVKTLVREAGIGKEEVGFWSEFFGVGNKANEIDITDTRAIDKMVKDGIKKKEAYDQMVIKNYLAGKTDIPKVPTGDAPAPTKDTEIKTLDEARKTLRERMKDAFKG